MQSFIMHYRAHPATYNYRGTPAPRGGDDAIIYAISTNEWTCQVAAGGCRGNNSGSERAAATKRAARTRRRRDFYSNRRVLINVFNGRVSFFRERRGYLHHSQLSRLRAVPLERFHPVTMRLLINEVQLLVGRATIRRAAARREMYREFRALDEFNKALS